MRRGIAALALSALAVSSPGGSAGTARASSAIPESLSAASIVEPLRGERAVSFGVASAAAPAIAGAQGAAQAYLCAYGDLLDAFADQVPAARRAGEAFVAEVSSGCPGVLAPAPPGPASAEMQELAVEALGLAFVAPLRGAAKRFAGTATRLDLGEPGLNRAVRRLARRDRLEASLAVPPVCAEAQAWAADGYRALTSGVVAEWHTLKIVVPLSLRYTQALGSLL
jgi:hypothetical protein